ncbi:hypothetical protein NH288_04860 [Anaerococcus sp. NML200537]|uniref:hypothetical protein n=1 Tax=Anaerococcus sp. NML200537 TaxID=2954485 RepID=UPI002238F2FC|nr:hypothetical protein [Anaerococcus sp. NML200537]MCW6701414.1 hypothetical protein [Anaerococcus sp. NML200537]
MTKDNLIENDDKVYEAKEEFWKIFHEEELIKVFDISLDALKSKLSKYDMYEHFKSLCKKECVYGKFWNVNEELDKWTLELREVDESGELYKTLKTMVLTYWIAQITLKLDRKQQYALEYINICKEELSEYMDFCDLAKCVLKVDEDKNILLNFLKENWNKNIEFEIDNIKYFIDYKDTKLNLRSNLEFKLQNEIYDY